MHVTVSPARKSPSTTALFVLPDGEMIGSYHLTLPVPLRESLEWFLPDGRVAARVLCLPGFPVLLELDRRETLDRLAAEVGRYCASSITVGPPGF